jgi:hypothetical protein
MPVVVDNNFSLDTYGNRTERLIAIQSNFASIQTELVAPANIETWAEDCYDVYALALSTSELEIGESEGATVVVAENEAILDEIYQNVKNMGITIYKDMPKLIEDYGFGLVYPIRRDEKIAKANRVLQCYARHVAAAVTPLIPAIMITRYQNAKDDFFDSIGLQDKERSDARHAVTALSDQFVADTQKLNELKIWWYAMMGKKDERITLIGMVNPDYGGGAHVLPAPTGLRFDFPTLTFYWNEVGGATSYSLEYSPDGIVDYVEIYNGSALEYGYTPPVDGWTFYRIRCRSAAGYSEYSTILQQGYYTGAFLPPPENLAVELVSGTTNSVKLTWDVVPSATRYLISKSEVAVGAGFGPYGYIGDSFVNEYIATVDSGHRYYYHLNCENSNQSSPVSGAVFIDVS